MPSKHLHMQARLSYSTVMKSRRGIVDITLSKTFRTKLLAGYLPLVSIFREALDLLLPDYIKEPLHGKTA